MRREISPCAELSRDDKEGDRRLNPRRYYRISVDFLFLPASDEILSGASDCVDTAISDPIR